MVTSLKKLGGDKLLDIFHISEKIDGEKRWKNRGRYVRVGNGF